MITIENVTFHHGRSRILHNVSLNIKKGGITAVIGPNGAGKSTLFSLMARISPLQSGSIRFDGLDIRKTQARELARKVAIMRQDTHVDSRISVRDMVGFGRYPHHQGRPSENDHDKVEKALDLFALTELAGRFLDELSGGQRQRVLVAMAYVQDTDYLLLDEPLNNLDMYYARELMRQLRDLADNHGKTVVVVLHEINYAASHADMIVALKDGYVVAHTDTASFMTEENLSRIYGMPVPIETVKGCKFAIHHT
ncbi:ABC transporter ATP-binding protein [Roseibium sp. RKSG952]|uniref:iron ABC transporter ATP-binding protein n=1 Tax=Roseibium sp. RKSG952 TaxID=2529384 RepID=UPI0012BD69F2|nr:ATP-binding cassette domain-containing protein [Roseibium sp. RKSG952]MTH95604.1 ATP-binding cassette domain-containing protein [Roseibium sp. RKSG952]